MFFVHVFHIHYFTAENNWLWFWPQFLQLKERKALHEQFSRFLMFSKHTCKKSIVGNAIYPLSVVPIDHDAMRKLVFLFLSPGKLNIPSPSILFIQPLSILKSLKVDFLHLKAGNLNFAGPTPLSSLRPTV